MPGKILTTLVNEKTYTLVLQRRDDGQGRWVDVRPFSQGTSIDYARTLMERYERQNTDVVYRLVEYVETHTKTMEVLG